MHKTDKSKIIDRYKSRVEDLGYSNKALGWLKNRQKFRFHYLQQILGFEQNDSVLDVGAAFGDLMAHLANTGWKGKYCGIDIVPELISCGKERYAGIDLREVDLQEDQFTERFDWVFCSGVLTSKTEAVDSYDHLAGMLKLMFSLCRKGISVNFLSPIIDFSTDINFHPDFGKLIQIISELTRRFTLRHDYMPYEFSVYLYADDQIDTKVNVFESNKKIYRKLKV